MDAETESSDPGRRIRAARTARSISLRSLASTIGVSPATLSQIENGHTGLSVRRLEAIAGALGVSAGILLDGRDDAASASSPRRPREAGTHWRTYSPLDFDPILLGALDEFLDVGYHGTSMRKISARCGVSVPGIYGHYASKQDLLMTVLSETMSELEWRADAAVAEGHDPVGKFCLIVENLALFHTHRRQLGFLGTSEVRALEPANDEAIAARRNRQQVTLDGFVFDAVRAGDFHVRDPGDAARAVVTMCTSLPNWWQPDGRLHPEDIAADYVGFALRLMGHRAAEIKMTASHEDSAPRRR
ncbi:TetR family transcriptional regulator [Gordonia sp. TBRC 11910]|uniref:TetR family transcriptional regulator n=1 Tax=Gordonia asplenii TaxID=2725283 RepID=A0A848KYP4_9ACTN|nr:TetR family transcriptional regulator [Gordonia asplenii]NMO01331.1 TetR family transcriptional regulator [Gordonia asplenii]